MLDHSTSSYRCLSLGCSHLDFQFQQQQVHLSSRATDAINPSQLMAVYQFLQMMNGPRSPTPVPQPMMTAPTPQVNTPPLRLFTLVRRFRMDDPSSTSRMSLSNHSFARSAKVSRWREHNASSVARDQNLSYVRDFSHRSFKSEDQVESGFSPAKYKLFREAVRTSQGVYSSTTPNIKDVGSASKIKTSRHVKPENVTWGMQEALGFAIDHSSKIAQSMDSSADLTNILFVTKLCNDQLSRTWNRQWFSRQNITRLELIPRRSSPLSLHPWIPPWGPCPCQTTPLFQMDISWLLRSSPGKPHSVVV